MKSNKKMAVVNSEENNFVKELKQIILSARKQSYIAINLSQVCANWLIGQRIVEQEQAGKNRAEYGRYLIKLVAKELTSEFGNGYSETNVKSFRKFYIEFQDVIKGQAVSAQSENGFQLTELAIRQVLPALLSWSHYECLMRVTNRKARDWYMRETAIIKMQFKKM